MKKNNQTNNFNFGKYLECIYCFWNNRITKNIFVNDLLDVFLKGEIPNYEIDKASVSKLTSHTYDLAKRVKETIGKTSDSKIDGFVSCIKSSITCSTDILAERIRGELFQAEEKESESVKQLYKRYEERNYAAFLFFAFKHAVAMPNLPFKPKSKTGRKPRGSHYSVFYLSEEEKEFERERLITKLFKSNDRLTKQDFDTMLELMAFASLDFTQEQKKIVALRFLKRWGTSQEGIGPAEEFLNRMRVAMKAFGDEKAGRFSNWKEAVDEAEIELTISPFFAAYRKAIRQNTYAEVRRALDSISFNNAVATSDVLKDALLKNRFFLPDFSGHITESLWSYCLSMAHLVRRAGLGDSFCEALNEIYSASSKNNTIRERIDALSRTAKGLKVV